MSKAICSQCGKIKDLSHFYKRKTGNRVGKYYQKCKKCMKARGKLYYHLHRDRQLPLVIARRRKSFALKSEYINQFKNRPCMDCGNYYPVYVMDFHHRDSQTKLGNIAHMRIKNWSLDKIKIEIAKCDIVCANCHRIRTFNALPR